LHYVKSLTTIQPFGAPQNFPNLENLTLFTSNGPCLIRSSSPWVKLHTLNIIGISRNIIRLFPVPNLQHLLCDVCTDPTCRKAANPDDIRLALSGDLSIHPLGLRFPKLCTLTLRVDCAHSNTPERRECDMKASKKFAQALDS
jgi:hypothetical protein